MNNSQLYQTFKRNKKIGIILIFTTVVLFIVIAKLRDVDQYEYLKGVFVSEAKILDKKINLNSSAPKYFVRLELVNQKVLLKEDQSWFEVNFAFYEKCKVNNKIGVLVGDFDVFKGSIFAAFGNTAQTYKNSNYAVIDVFDSLDQANEKYPHKSFTADAQVVKKTTSKNEGNYLVLSYEEREMSVRVDSDLYNKYKESDMVSCDFDGIGDFIKIIGVK